MEHGKLGYLQALRGIAALMVVLYHGSRFISPYGEGLGHQLFGAGGVMGVDLFFVISGFIMVYTTSRPGTSAKDFAIKRFSRIWPVYVAISLVYVLATFGMAYFGDPAHKPRILSTILMVPMGTSDGASIYYPSLAVGWSLNFEAYFYLVFGLSLLFGRWRWLAFFGWIGLTLLAVPLLTGRIPVEGPHMSYGYANPMLALATSPMIWMFVAGVAIGLIHRTGFRLPSYWAGILAAFAVTLYAFQYASGWLVQHGMLHGGLFAALLVLALSLSAKSAEIPTPKALVVLGNISFSLYLVHPLVQERSWWIFNDNGWIGYAAGFSFLFLTTALAIVLAAVSYKLLERGLAEWVKRMLSGRPAGLPASQTAYASTLQ
jgi:exopolysaccharide production protein ExoZ